MDETGGLRDTGEREAAAGSIDEGYGEVPEFIHKSSIDLTRYHTRSNATKASRICKWHFVVYILQASQVAEPG